MTTSTLRTARLLIEPYRPEDEDHFVGLFADERIARWMGNPPQGDAAERAMFGRIFSKVYAQDLFDVWAVRRDGRYVGHAELKHTDDVDGHELVYALAHDSWGAGLGTEIARALAEYGFGVLGLPAVHATVAEENQASLVLLGRLGFRHVRDIREDDGTLTRHLTLDRPA